MAMVVLLWWAGGARRQIRWFEGVDQVHLCEDGRGRDEIQLLLWLVHLHLNCINFSQLCLGQVVHDAGAERVANHVDGSPHPVPEWQKNTRTDVLDD